VLDLVETRPKGIQNSVELRRLHKDWFTRSGAYVLFDGQFGSTGKGALAAYMATVWRSKISVVTSNAGPNSGHTAYTQEGDKIVTTQLPIAAVFLNRYGEQPLTYLNSGAVINPLRLMDEIGNNSFPERRLYISPNAAVINEGMPEADAHHIASTGKGVGPAIADKLMRRGNVMKNQARFQSTVAELIWDWNKHVVFVEVPQGFSLSLNSEFYPHCTSRECTVGQALSDARIPASRLRKSIMAVRTFPIRVGSTLAGSSGGWYPDQRELTWEELGQVPETTTVTGRQRRIATWSDGQFKDALRVNEPNALFINFLNYLSNDDSRTYFIDKVIRTFSETLRRQPDFVLGGYGPLLSDIKLEFSSER
jgi:adenylosuccinate synthase